MFFDEIIYGTQYYRAPTPLLNEWETDIKNMCDLNIDPFQIRVQWRKNEREEGQYNFNDIDHLFDLAKKYNRRVIFKFMLESAPQYIFDRYEGTRLSFDGTPILPGNHGAFYLGGWMPCFDNPKVIERAIIFVEECVKRYKDRDELLLWNVWNEPRTRPAGDCCCKYSRSLFREWLKKEYKTIENLNDIFGTAEERFDKVAMPGMPHGYWDFFLFRKWRSGDALFYKLKFVYEAIRKYDIHKPIMSHVGVSAGIQSDFNDNSDDYIVSKAVDFYGTSLAVGIYADHNTRPFCGLICDYLRGIDKNFFVNELYSDWGEWYEPSSREDLRFKVWTAIAHGAKGLVYWQMRAERLGNENNLSGFVNMDGTYKQITKEIKQIGGALHENMDIFKNAVPAKNDIIFVHDYASSLMSQIEDHEPSLHSFAKSKTPVDYFFSANVGMYNLFYDLGISVDYIDSRSIERILDYKIAYFPYSIMLNSDCEDTLIKFVENGGTLLLDEGFGLRQQNTWLSCNEIPFKTLIKAKWYYRVREYEERFMLSKKEVTIKPFKTVYQVEDAMVLAAFLNGKPAIFKVKKGKGEIILFGTSIGYSYYKEKETGWLDFIKDILAFKGIEKNPYSTAIEGLTTYTAKTNEKDLLFVFNWTGKIQNIITEKKIEKELIGKVKYNENAVTLENGDVACLVFRRCTE